MPPELSDEVQCSQAATWAHQQAREFLAAVPTRASSPSSRARSSGLETSVHAPGDASTQKHCQGSDGTQARGSVVLDVAEWL
jgi:hypothetical protein